MADEAVGREQQGLLCLERDSWWLTLIFRLRFPALSCWISSSSGGSNNNNNGRSNSSYLYAERGKTYPSPSSAPFT